MWLINFPGYHLDFQYLIVSVHLFISSSGNASVKLIAITKKKFSQFFDGKTLLYP